MKMSKKSDLSSVIRKAVISHISEKASEFKERATLYKELVDQKNINAEISEIDSHIRTTRSASLEETLKQLKEDKIKKLNEINTRKERLGEDLVLPVFINYTGKEMQIIIPVTYEGDRNSLVSRLSSTVVSHSGNAQTEDYEGLQLIVTHANNRKKLLEALNRLNNEKDSPDFKEAHIVIAEPDEYRDFELSLSAIEKPGKKESSGRIYTTKDLGKELDVSRAYASEITKRFYLSQGKQWKRVRERTFLEGEYQDIINYWKAKKGEQIELVQISEKEKKYTIANVQDSLGISKTAAGYRVRNYFRKEGLKHKFGKAYKLTEKQFKEITSKETIQKAFRERIKEEITAGNKPEDIFEKYKRDYKGNLGTLRGTINCLNKHYRKK